MKAPQKYEEMKRKNQLKNDLFYKSGDTEVIQTYYTTGGFISSGSTNVQFSFPTEKSMKNISSIEIKNISCSLRSIEGYLRPDGDTNKVDFVKTNFGTIKVLKISNNLLRIDLSIDSGYKINANTNATNNRPISATLTTLELEFKK